MAAGKAHRWAAGALAIVLAAAETGRAGQCHEVQDRKALKADPARAEGPIAPVLGGLGDHHHAVTTRSGRAQLFFDQGLKLEYAFNHQEALRAFKEAARLDPGCAMAGTLVPMAAPLVGTLMLGNLMKESGVVERLTGASSKEIANTVTLFLGLAIGSTMRAEAFLSVATLQILALGILAFGLDTAAGVTFGKLMCRLSGWRLNPLVGAAGISAFPMAARVVNRVGLEEDFENFLLMHAMGANTAGQIASTVAGGVLLALLGAR